MNEIFKASNGVDIKETPDFDSEMTRWAVGDALFRHTAHELAALREFFRHERDEELGRWRWPENPDYVVYEDKARCYINQPAVIVFNEADGASAMCGRDGLYSASGIGVNDKWCEPAAAAYFAAHPEPKPWHDAKPGEVWVLETNNGKTHGGVVDASRYLHSIDSDGNKIQIALGEAWITTGRRIFPEVTDA